MWNILKKNNNELVRTIKWQPIKKRPNVPTSVISAFFCYKKTLQKGWCVAKRLSARPWPFDCEKNLPLQFIESVWFNHLTLHLSPIIVFPFRK